MVSLLGGVQPGVNSPQTTENFGNVQKPLLKEEKKAAETARGALAALTIDREEEVVPKHIRILELEEALAKSRANLALINAELAHPYYSKSNLTGNPQQSQE